jgi:predicted nucleic acid-binding protein
MRLIVLDTVRAGFEFDPITQDALDKAAELWAAVRNAGLATAHPAALDGDAILAAQTILAANAGDVVTIATNNARHLSRFPGIDARPWASVTP